MDLFSSASSKETLRCPPAHVQLKAHRRQEHRVSLA